MPNQPLLRRPTGYPTAGNRRVEKRPRLEETEVGDGEGAAVNEGGDAEEEGEGDLTELQVLQRLTTRISN